MLKQLASTLCAIFIAGCTANPAAHDSIRDVAGLDGEVVPIRLHVDGGPLDVDGEEPHTLSLREAVRLAIQNDPRLQAALARVRIAEAEVLQSRLLPNPVLDIALRYPTGGGKPVIEANLAADLIAILQRPRKSSAAEHRLRAECADVLITALDLLVEIQEHYAAIQTTEARITVLEERRAILTRLIDLAKARHKAGEGTPLDVTTLDAQRLELEADLSARQSDRIDERLALARLIGQPSAAAQWRIPRWEVPRPLDATEKQLMSAALDRRPEIQAGQWTLVALGDEVALAKLAALEGSEVGVASERDAEWTVGPAFRAPLPVFDWGQARRAKAEAEVTEARHKLTLARRQAVEEVRRAYSAFQTARAAAERARSELLPLQERRRQQTEAAYRAGEADLATLLIAESDLQQAKEKLIELDGKTITAAYRLQRAIGGTLPPHAASPTTGPTTRDAR